MVKSNSRKTNSWFRWSIVISAAVCLCMMMLAGCGSGEDTASSEAEETEYPIVLEDNEYFKFEVTGTDDFWEEYECKITNKTDKDVVFDCEKGVVNEENTVDAYLYADIAANTSTKESLSISQDQLEDYEEGEEITITIDYDMTDDEMYDEITSGSFDFTFTKHE